MKKLLKKLGKKTVRREAAKIIKPYSVPCTSDCFGQGTSVYLGTGYSRW